MALSRLPTRSLGKNGPQVTALGFGLMGLSSFYGPVKSVEERLKFLDYVFEAGETNWDSSDLYGDNFPGHQVWIITKAPVGIRSDSDYVKEACEKSLKRLGIEAIDLYYAHRLDLKTPVERTVEAMAKLKRAGKIKYLGLSEVSAASLRRAYKVHPISAVQIEYSPFTLDIEDPKIALLETCRELGVSVVGYSPLGRGFLTGKYKSPEDFATGDMRKFLPRFSTENSPKNLELLGKINLVAEEIKEPVGAVTLTWLLAQGTDVIPIPGTTKPENFDENLRALRINLSKDQFSRIRVAVNNAQVYGDRYDPRSMAICFADTPVLNEQNLVA